ncbi:MAG: flagellar export chaperone FliS [Clostridiales bacterium]|nr:flagellar export chaperone FliS [Clostridiales bacterium]
MTAYGIGLQEYKEQAVNMMTPGEMLILLYDEIVKRLKKAEMLAKNSDFANFENEIKRAQDVVAYLNNALDRRIEISKNLAQLYSFFNYQMARITAGRNLHLIDELIPLVEDLRDTYKQADKLSKIKL